MKDAIVDLPGGERLDVPAALLDDPTWFAEQVRGLVANLARWREIAARYPEGSKMRELAERGQVTPGPEAARRAWEMLPEEMRSHPYSWTSEFAQQTPLSSPDEPQPAEQEADIEDPRFRFRRARGAARAAPGAPPAEVLIRRARGGY